MSGGEHQQRSHRVPTPGTVYLPNRHKLLFCHVCGSLCFVSPIDQLALVGLSVKRNRKTPTNMTKSPHTILKNAKTGDVPLFYFLVWCGLGVGSGYHHSIWDFFPRCQFILCCCNSGVWYCTKNERRHPAGWASRVNQPKYNLGLVRVRVRVRVVRIKLGGLWMTLVHPAGSARRYQAVNN